MSKFISDVEVGDRVLSANSNREMSYSDVVFVPHDYNDQTIEFIELSTNMNNSVRFTGNHLVSTCSGALAFAGSLKIGACVQTVAGDSLLTTIRHVKSRGMYTVVTMNEFLVVGGIVASPFSVNHRVVHSYYNIHRVLFKLVPYAMSAPFVVLTNSVIGSIAAFLIDIASPEIL